MNKSHFLNLIKQITAGVLVLTVIAFAVPYGANAIVNYPASAGLGIGSVQGKHILDGTITGSDIASTSQFIFRQVSIGTSTRNDLLAIWSATTTSTQVFTIADAASTTNFALSNLGVISAGIWQGTPIARGYGGTGTSTWPTGAIPFADLTKLTGDVNNLNWDNINKKLGIGTSSPSEALSVSGEFYVTASTTFNNVEYGWPANAGTNGYALKTSGTGVLSWGDFTANWTFFTSTTTSVSMTTATVSVAEASSTEFRVIVTHPAFAQNNALQIKFNNDTGSNCAFRDSYNGGADRDGGARQWCEMAGGNVQTNPGEAIIEISNHYSSPKSIFWRYILTPIVTATPNRAEGVGYWNNSTSTINSIQFGGSSGNNLPAGVIIRIWKSSN